MNIKYGINPPTVPDKLREALEGVDDLNELEDIDPLTKVTITFADGEEFVGIYVCEMYSRCYVVTDPSLKHPPGWFVKRYQIKVRK